MSVKARQQEIIDNMSFFEDWTDKYSYIISLAKSLPEFPEAKKTEKNLVKGCQSQVWFDAVYQQGKLHFIGISDASIVSGLIGMLLHVYNDAEPSDILQSDTGFMDEIGLGKNLSPTRNNGLHSMVNFIYNTAKQYA